MIRAVLFSALLPSTAAAGVSTSLEHSAFESATAVRLTSAFVQDTTRARPQPPPPPPQQRRGRRQPSYVGYIPDATIGSQVRVRFDAASEVDVPDRAEFLYAKCGCYRTAPPPAHDADAPGPGPAVVTGLAYRQLYLQAEYAPHARVSLFAELPVRWLQPEEFVPGSGTIDDQSGISDVRAGVKVGLLDAADRQVTLSLQGSAPTGAADKGLGTDHWTLEPLILSYGRVADRVTMEGVLGAIIPIDGSAGVPTSSSEGFAGTVLVYGIGPAVEVYRGESVQIAPVVELIGWRVLDGFQTVDGTPEPAEDINIVNLKLGARLSLRERSSFYVGYGKALTDRVWYDDIFRIEYRLGF
jgi:hypothetical protein